MRCEFSPCCVAGDRHSRASRAGAISVAVGDDEDGAKPAHLMIAALLGDIAHPKLKAMYLHGILGRSQFPCTSLVKKCAGIAVAFQCFENGFLRNGGQLVETRLDAILRDLERHRPVDVDVISGYECA